MFFILASNIIPTTWPSLCALKALLSQASTIRRRRNLNHSQVNSHTQQKYWNIYNYDRWLARVLLLLLRIFGRFDLCYLIKISHLSEWAQHFEHIKKGLWFVLVHCSSTKCVLVQCHEMAWPSIGRVVSFFDHFSFRTGCLMSTFFFCSCCWFRTLRIVHKIN